MCGWQGMGLLGEEMEAAAVGQILRFCPGLNKVTIGELLGENDDFHLSVLDHFTQTFQFEGKIFCHLLNFCSGYECVMKMLHNVVPSSKGPSAMLPCHGLLLLVHPTKRGVLQAQCRGFRVELRSSEERRPKAQHLSLSADPLHLACWVLSQGGRVPWLLC